MSNLLFILRNVLAHDLQHSKYDSALGTVLSFMALHTNFYISNY